MANIYIVNVPQDQPSFIDGMNAIIASGLGDFDVGYLNIDSASGYTGTGNFIIESGAIYVKSTNGINIDSLNIITSGTLSFENVRIESLEASGYGQLNLIGVSGNIISANGLYGIYVASGVVSDTMLCNDIENVSIISHNVSGNVFYDFSKIKNISITGGNYSYFDDSNYKLSFTNCSGVLIENMKASNLSGSFLNLSGCPWTTINYCTLVSNVSGYNIVNLQTAGGLYSSGIIRYSILTGDAGYSNGPITIGSGSYIESDNSYLYNFITDATYVDVSGSYINRDPIFVDASGGNILLDINSPCACRGEPLEFISAVDGIVSESTVLTSKAIKFYERYQKIKTNEPSGIYVVGSGLAVFFQSASGLYPEMDIVVNKQYKIQSSGVTFQSYINSVGISGYTQDYKIIPYKDYETQTNKYYVQPFTMLSFQEIATAFGGVMQDIEISGKYSYVGFTRDRFQDSDGTPIYWVGEKYNNYLYAFSSLTGDKIATYPLFPYSGIINNVNVDGIGYVSRIPGNTIVKTDKVFVNDHYETRLININSTDSGFPFKSFETDFDSSVAALATTGDRMVILQKEGYEYEGLFRSNHNLVFFNKYDEELFTTPEGVISGITNLTDVNVGDITFTDIGNLWISVSGSIQDYKLFYDYGLATWNLTPNASIKTTLLLREEYEGVSV